MPILFMRSAEISCGSLPERGGSKNIEIENNMTKTAQSSIKNLFRDLLIKIRKPYIINIRQRYIDNI